MGRAASEPDPDHYEHQYAHCDVLVIGGGAAGLAAARAAAHAGARVILCDENATCGGSLLGREATIDGRRRRWVGCRSPSSRASECHAAVCARRRSATTTAISSGGRACRRSSAGAAGDTPRQRLWKVRAQAGGARQRRDRARHRVREQRSAGNDARGRGAHLRRALRGAAGFARRRVHQQRQRVCDALALHAAGSRSPRSSTRVLGSLSGALPARRAPPASHRSPMRRSSGPRSQRVAAVDVAPVTAVRSTHRLRSRLRVRRLEPRGPSLFAGSRQASLRRRARNLRPRRRRRRSRPPARPTADSTLQGH